MLGSAACVGSWVSASVLFLQEWLNIESSSVVWFSVLLWLIIVPALTVLPNPQLMMLLCLNILCIPWYEWCVHTHPQRVFCPEQQRWSVYGSAQGDFPNQPETASAQSLLFPLPAAVRRVLEKDCGLCCTTVTCNCSLVVSVARARWQHPCHSREQLWQQAASLGGRVQSQLRIPHHSSASCILNIPWQRLPRAGARSRSACVTVLCSTFSWAQLPLGTN